MTDPDYAAELRRYIRHLQAELKALEVGGRTPPAPDPISDHAVVRYMERVKGVDMRRLRAEIPPHERRGLLKAGPGRIKCGGYELFCGNGVGVMVMPLWRHVHCGTGAGSAHNPSRPALAARSRFGIAGSRSYCG